MDSTMAFPEPITWQLEVAAVAPVTPRMRRIQLTGPALETFSYLPGQDLALGLRRDDGTTVRRRYTIRRFVPTERLLELHVVMHGDGPGMRWAQAAAPAVPVDAIGPRGKITLAADAGWHLFAGDATAVPGALAMMEALPAGVAARAFLQVDDATERQPFDVAGDKRVTWRYEGDAPAGQLDRLIVALSSEEFPRGRGHAYLAGEVSLVRALQAALLSRGWSPEQISAKAYWNRGRANADRGEPEQRAS
jgi:NADPH-dependent ferric siderophore reductase